MARVEGILEQMDKRLNHLEGDLKSLRGIDLRDLRRRGLLQDLRGIPIIGTPGFYSESRRSVYELKFIQRNPKLYKHHRLRACIYKWLSDTEVLLSFWLLNISC